MYGHPFGAFVKLFYPFLICPFHPVTEIFVDFIAVLEDFGEYTDPEAFEVWGRSLMKVNDYQTAKKKITLALENAKVIYVSEKPHTHRIA